MPSENTMAPRPVIPGERTSARIRAQTRDQVKASLVEARKKEQQEAQQGIDHDDEEYQDADDDDDGGPADIYMGGGGFEPKPSLRRSEAKKYTVSELEDMLNGEYLDLCPEYQRDVVWNLKRMSGLIDSIMENYYIPPILFHIKWETIADGTKRKYRACIDGKQRLSSVDAFLHGDIPCHDRNGKAWYFSHRVEKNEHGNMVIKQKRNQLLPPEVQASFKKKQLVCYEFLDLSPGQEEDLFARVQKGVQLTPAEKMTATAGAWQDYVKLFMKDFAEVVQLANTDRSMGFRNILACFATICEVQSPTHANGKPRLQGAASQLVNFLKNEKWLTEKTKLHLSRVFTIFKELVQKDRQTFMNNGYRTAKLFSPVEMVAVSVLISMYMDKGRNNELLLRDIQVMRKDIRDNMPDLRMHPPTWNVIWEWLDTLEEHRGSIDNSKEPIRERQFQSSREVHPRIKREAQTTRSQMTRVAQSSRTRLSVVSDADASEHQATKYPTPTSPTRAIGAPVAPVAPMTRSYTPDSVFGDDGNDSDDLYSAPEPVEKGPQTSKTAITVQAGHPVSKTASKPPVIPAKRAKPVVTQPTQATPQRTTTPSSPRPSSSSRTSQTVGGVIEDPAEQTAAKTSSGPAAVPASAKPIVTQPTRSSPQQTTTTPTPERAIKRRADLVFGHQGSAARLLAQRRRT